MEVINHMTNIKTIVPFIVAAMSLSPGIMLFTRIVYRLMDVPLITKLLAIPTLGDIMWFCMVLGIFGASYGIAHGLLLLISSKLKIPPPYILFGTFSTLYLFLLSYYSYMEYQEFVWFMGVPSIIVGVCSLCLMSVANRKPNNHTQSV